MSSALSVGGRSPFDEPIGDGAFLLDLNLRFRPQTQYVHGDDRLSFTRLARRSPEAAEHGDVDFFTGQLDAVARYGLSGRTEAFLALPLRSQTLRVDVEDAHHRDETFTGLGDPRVGVRHFFASDAGFQLGATAGLSLPAGRLHRVTTESFIDHDKAASLGIRVPEHSHLRLGTGTVDPFVGLEALWRFAGDTLLFTRVSGDLPLYENRYDYRTSPSGTLLAGPAWRNAGGGTILGVFAEAFWSGRDAFDGNDVSGPGGTFAGSFGVPNTGRFELALLPTLSWASSESLTINVQLRVPVYTRIREDAARDDVQLVEPFGLFVGFSLSF